MGTIINLTCEDRELVQTSSPVVASGGNNENSIHVVFGSAWETLVKTAVFYQTEAQPYHVVMDNNGNATIPHEVTDEPGRFFIGVFGIAGNVIKTSSMLSYQNVLGAITPATVPKNPTQDVYFQIIAMIQAGTIKGDSAFIRYSAYADGTDMSTTWTEGKDYIGVMTAREASTEKTDYTWMLFKGGSTFIRYSAYADGTDMSETWSIGKNYMGIMSGRVASYDRTAYTWVLARGMSTFVRYSASSDGTGMTETWSAGQNYLGIMTGLVASTDKTNYTWVLFKGDSGNPSGSILQVKGQSTTDTMSQKAITDEVNAANTKIQAIKDVEDTIYFTFEQGACDGSGDYSATNRIRTGYLSYADLVAKGNIYIESGYIVRIRTYKPDGSYIAGAKQQESTFPASKIGTRECYDYQWDYEAVLPYAQAGTLKVRFVLSKADNSDITPQTAGDKAYQSNSCTLFTKISTLEATSGSHTASIAALNTAVAGKEASSNKVTSLSASSTDTQYPSAKCVYDAIDDVTFPIVQEPGTSTTSVMSQNAATNSFASESEFQDVKELNDTILFTFEQGFCDETGEHSSSNRIRTVGYLGYTDLVANGNIYVVSGYTLLIRVYKPDETYLAGCISQTGTFPASKIGTRACYNYDWDYEAVLPYVQAGTLKVRFVLREVNNADITPETAGDKTYQKKSCGLFNKINELDSDSDSHTASITALNTAVAGKEASSNKVTSLSSSSTDTQYPSAKCVYDEVKEIDTVKDDLDGIKNLDVDRYFTFEQGACDSTGDYSASNRIRTVGYLVYSEMPETVYVTSGYKVLIRLYKPDGTYLAGLQQQTSTFDIDILETRAPYNSDDEYNTCLPYVQAGTAKIRFVVGKTDNADITPQTAGSKVYYKDSCELIEKIDALDEQGQELVGKVSAVEGSVIGTFTFEQGACDGSGDYASDYRIRTKERVYYKALSDTITVPDGYVFLPRIYNAVTRAYICGGTQISSSFSKTLLTSSSEYDAGNWQTYQALLSTGKFDVRFVVKKSSEAAITPSDAPTVNYEKNDFYAVGDGATDDSYELARYLASHKEAKIPYGKYLVSSTVDVDTTLTSLVDCSSSVFTVSADVPCFRIVGNCTTASGPDEIPEATMKAGGFTFCNARITATSNTIGTAIKVTATFSAKITHCYLYKINAGIYFDGRNRDGMVTENHIWGCYTYGIYFSPSTNFHQCNISANIIDFMLYPIYYDNCTEAANHQITGNDIEIDSFPTGGTANRAIVMVSDDTKSGIFCEMEFSGNTIQGHTHSPSLIEISGGTNRYVQNISFTGNHISNCTGNAIVLKKVRGFSFSTNNYKDVGGYIFKLDGTIKFLSIVGESGFSVTSGLLIAPSTANLEHIASVACALNNRTHTVETTSVSDVRFVDN